MKLCHRNQEKSSSGKRMRSLEIMRCVQTGTVTTTQQKWSRAEEECYIELPLGYSSTWKSMALWDLTLKLHEEKLPDILIVTDEPQEYTNCTFRTPILYETLGFTQVQWKGCRSVNIIMPKKIIKRAEMLHSGNKGAKRMYFRDHKMPQLWVCAV